jgi:hypothetical protein
MDAAKHGMPHLRRQLSSAAASVNHKTLLEHALVKDAVGYWTEALAVVTSANAARKVNAVRVLEQRCCVVSLILQSNLCSHQHMHYAAAFVPRFYNLNIHLCLRCCVGCRPGLCVVWPRTPRRT